MKQEIYVQSRNAVAHTEFHRLGLTDAAILTTIAEDMLLLSTDGPLCRAAVAAGHNAQHFYEPTEAGREVRE